MVGDPIHASRDSAEMGRTQRLILVGIVVWLLPQTIAAQAAPAYRAPVDTQYIEVSNPYHLYLIRGSDTVGNPIFEQRTRSFR